MFQSSPLIGGLTHYKSERYNATNMSLHHAIITLKTDRQESGSIQELLARIHEVTLATKKECSEMGLHVEEIDPVNLRIYGTTEQIGDLVKLLLEQNNLGALRIQPLEKVPFAEIGSGD